MNADGFRGKMRQTCAKSCKELQQSQSGLRPRLPKRIRFFYFHTISGSAPTLRSGGMNPPGTRLRMAVDGCRNFSSGMDFRIVELRRAIIACPATAICVSAGSA